MSGSDAVAYLYIWSYLSSHLVMLAIALAVLAAGAVCVYRTFAGHERRWSWRSCFVAYLGVWIGIAYLAGALLLVYLHSAARSRGVNAMLEACVLASLGEIAFRSLRVLWRAGLRVLSPARNLKGRGLGGRDQAVDGHSRTRY